MTKTVLVLGATGGVGHEVAHAFLRRGWHVKALCRRPMASDDGIEWVVGDAMRAGDVARAAAGATLLFHGVNPPGYKNWRGLADSHAGQRHCGRPGERRPAALSGQPLRLRAGRLDARGRGRAPPPA